jgi:hypothetical protein
MNSLMALRIIALTISLADLGFGQIKTPVALPPPEKRFAVLVGVGKYNDITHEFSDLDSSVEDVFLTKQALIRDMDFKNENIFVLTDSVHASARPTRENILNALYQIPTMVGVDVSTSLLVFMFTGHGKSVGDASFLVPAGNFYFPSDEFSQESYLSDEDISKIIRDIGVGNVLVFLDSCRDQSSSIKATHQFKLYLSPHTNAAFFTQRNLEKNLIQTIPIAFLPKL